MAGRVGARKVSAAQVVEIWQYLTTYFDKEKKIYIEGWSDSVIADRVKCSLSSVNKIRGDNFGYIDRSAGKKLELEARVEALEAAVRRLEDLWTKPVGDKKDA